MPLVNADWKSLEWLGVVYLSKDEVGYDEIRRGVDQHSDNQSRLGLPSRLIAKKFVFRLIYGGQASTYAGDPDFSSVGFGEKEWENVVTNFYLKYSGIARWHSWIVEEVMREGQLEIPTGRIFKFAMEYGKWPITTIKNYPVQGFSADLMVLARVLIKRRISRLFRTKLLCTVHDSVVLDSPDEEVDYVVDMLYNVWRDIPNEFALYFGVPFDLPCKVEVSVGDNWKDMTERKEK